MSDGVPGSDWTAKREWWKPSQVAAELHVVASTVRRWCDDGILRCTRTPGGHVRIARADLKAFYDDHGPGPTPAMAA